MGEVCKLDGTYFDDGHVNFMAADNLALPTNQVTKLPAPSQNSHGPGASPGVPVLVDVLTRTRSPEIHEIPDILHLVLEEKGDLPAGEETLQKINNNQSPWDYEWQKESKIGDDDFNSDSTSTSSVSETISDTPRDTEHGETAGPLSFRLGDGSGPSGNDEIKCLAEMAFYCETHGPYSTSDYTSWVQNLVLFTHADCPDCKRLRKLRLKKEIAAGTSYVGAICSGVVGIVLIAKSIAEACVKQKAIGKFASDGKMIAFGVVLCLFAIMFTIVGCQFQRNSPTCCKSPILS